MAAPSFSMDYVYMTAEDSFKNIHVDLYVKEAKPEFQIQSPDDLSAGDLEQIVAYFQQTQFDKLRINLYVDCNVVLVVRGAREAVHFVNDGPSVLEFTQL